MSRIKTQKAKSDLEKQHKEAQRLIDMFQLGNFNGVIHEAKKLLKQFPRNSEIHNIMGAALRKIGEHSIALQFFKKSIALNGNYAEAYNNVGNTFRDLGETEKAIKAFKTAVKLAPNMPQAYYNLGLLFNRTIQFEIALPYLIKATQIKPDYTAALNELGICYKFLGLYDLALKTLQSAIKLNNNFADAHNNLGTVYQDQANLEAARISFGMALSIDPTHWDAVWNMSQTADDIHEAKKWIDMAQKIRPSSTQTILTKAAIDYYLGDEDLYNNLKNSDLKSHSYMRSFEWVFNLPRLPKIYFHRWSFFDAMLDICDKSRVMYEFGVWRGEAFKYLMKAFSKGYGFDTFEGLPETWHSEKAGTYSSNGSIPFVEGGEFIAGRFEDTLPLFFSSTRPMASIINFDADLYSSTICALQNARPVIDENTILIFDEFIINNFWEADEYKALNEFCESNGYFYEVLAISFATKQVAVRLIT